MSTVNEAPFELVAMAASAGGIRACAAVLGVLPSEFPAAVVVVQHHPPGTGGLAPVFARRCRLPVREPQPGDRVEPGVVYIAPPVQQLLVRPDRRFTLAPSTAPRSRCRADPLFESAAAAYRERLLAVVLTGRLDDGAAGVRVVKALGGRILAQNEATAEFFEMPRAAIATGTCDFVLPIDTIGWALVALTMVPGAPDLFRVPAPPWATLAAPSPIPGLGEPVAG